MRPAFWADSLTVKRVTHAEDAPHPVYVFVRIQQSMIKRYKDL